MSNVQFPSCKWIPALDGIRAWNMFAILHALNGSFVCWITYKPQSLINSESQTAGRSIHKTTKKRVTPAGSCLPIQVLLVSKQCKTARSIRAISYSIRKNRFWHLPKAIFILRIGIRSRKDRKRPAYICRYRKPRCLLFSKARCWGIPACVRFRRYM